MYQPDAFTIQAGPSEQLQTAYLTGGSPKLFNGVGYVRAPGLLSYCNGVSVTFTKLEFCVGYYGTSSLGVISQQSDELTIVVSLLALWPCRRRRPARAWQVAPYESTSGSAEVTENSENLSPGHGSIYLEARNPGRRACRIGCFGIDLFPAIWTSRTSHSCTTTPFVPKGGIWASGRSVEEI